MNTVRAYTKLIIPALLLMFPGCSQPQSSTTKEIVDAKASDFSAGRGLDRLTGSALGDCVVVTDPMQPRFDSNSKESILRISLIKSSSELVEDLAVAPKAKYIPGLDVTKSKASFAHKLSVNSQSVYLLINVQVTSPTFTLQNVKLSDEAIRLFNERGPDAFRKTCGDEFVRSKVPGAEFAAVLEFQTQDDDQKRDIEASLTESSGAFSGSLKFSTQLEEAIRNNMTKIHVYQSGGEVGKLDLTGDGILAKVEAFADTVTAGNAKTLAAITKPYHTLLNFPTTGSSINVDSQERVLDELARYDLELSDKLTSVEYLLQHPVQYPAYNITKFTTKVDEIRAVISIVRNAASACVGSYRNCAIPELSIPDVELPSRKQRIVVPEKTKLDPVMKYQISKLYSDCLGRAVESEDAYALWIEKGNRNGVESVTGGICKSAEAKGDVAIRRAITAAYRNCLARDPESESAYDDWASIARSDSVQVMRSQVCSSPEAKDPNVIKSAVQYVYNRCLNRLPESTQARDHWMNVAIQHGSEYMVDRICGSDEGIHRL